MYRLQILGRCRKLKQIDKHLVFFIHADIFNHGESFKLFPLTSVKDSGKLQIVQFSLRS